MARKLINTKKISYEEWIELRKKSIGGSDSAICVGMNQYGSLIKLYADKKGLSNDKVENEAMRLGTDLEEYVAKRYMEETGKKVRVDNFMYQDDEYDFMTANVDRVIVGENAGLECKTMGSFGKYDLENGEVPAHYYCQCQHYMSVMGYDYMDLAILVLQKGLYINRIERSESFIFDLRAAEIDFWTNYIEKDNCPAPDGSDSSMDAVKLLYNTPTHLVDSYIPGADEAIDRIKILDEMIKKAEGEKKELQQKLCSKLGVGGVGFGDKYGCSWKTQSRCSFDSKKLKEDYPELYAKYSSVTEYPVFRTRKLKKEGK